MGIGFNQAKKRASSLGAIWWRAYTSRVARSLAIVMLSFTVTSCETMATTTNKSGSSTISIRCRASRMELGQRRDRRDTEIIAALLEIAAMLLR